MLVAKAIASRIVDLCEDRNISINKLAVMSGLTQSTLQSIIRFHDLRHTSASLQLSSGANIADISRRLGHSDISSISPHAFTSLAKYYTLFS